MKTHWTEGNLSTKQLQTQMGIVTYILLVLVFNTCVRGAEVHIRTEKGSSLAAAIRAAKPGDDLLIHPGTYRGGLWFVGISGTENSPIRIRAADPKVPPIISGGDAGFQFSACSHLIIENIIFEGQGDNGLNIDDNEEFRKGNFRASNNITLYRITIKKLRGSRNNDGIKISGVSDFLIEDCSVEGWGNEGCGIDMVACGNGRIRRCHFDGMGKGGWGIQAKGGSRAISVENCQVKNILERGIQIGGETGAGFFRDKNARWESDGFTIENSTVVGGEASIAIVNATNSTIQFCRLLYPSKWFIRILVENESRNLEGCRDGVIRGNLFIKDSKRFIGPVDIGRGSEASTFRFLKNIWSDVSEAKDELRYGLPTKEIDGLSNLEIPSAFIKSEVSFSEKHYLMLRQILDEVEVVELSVRRRNTVFVSAVLACLGFALLIAHRLFPPMRRDNATRNRRLRRFLVLGMIIAAAGFYTLHLNANRQVESVSSDYKIIANPAQSISQEGLQTGKRFETCVEFIFLSGAILLLGISARNVLPFLEKSMLQSLGFGLAIGVMTFYLKRILHSEIPNCFFQIYMLVGGVSGLLLYAFSRHIQASISHLIKNRISKSNFVDEIALYGVGACVILSLVSQPLEFDPEFIYLRWRSLAINSIPFSRFFTAMPSVNLVVSAILLGLVFSRGNLSRAMDSRFWAAATLKIFLFYMFLESLDYFRFGQYVEMDQVLIASCTAMISMLLTRFASKVPTDEPASDPL